MISCVNVWADRFCASPLWTCKGKVQMQDHTGGADDVCNVVVADSREPALYVLERDLRSSCCSPGTPDTQMQGVGFSRTLGADMPPMTSSLHTLEWEDVLKRDSSDALACNTPSLAHSGGSGCWSADSNVQQALSMWAGTDAATPDWQPCTEPQYPRPVASKAYQALAVQLPGASFGPASSHLSRLSGSAGASPFFPGGDAPSSSSRCSCRSEPGRTAPVSSRDTPSDAMGGYGVSRSCTNTVCHTAEPRTLPMAAFASLGISEGQGARPSSLATVPVPLAAATAAAAAAQAPASGAAALAMAADTASQDARRFAPRYVTAGGGAGGAAVDMRVATLAESSRLPPAMARPAWSMSQFIIQRRLYKGANSSVYQAVDIKSGMPVALKMYYMAMLATFNRHQVLREVRLHAALDHPNIIQLYAAFQEQDVVVVVLEYAGGGDLYGMLRRVGGRLSEVQAVQLVLAPFLGALAYMHGRGYIHRDIKPENLLFALDGTLKLADLGLAIDLNQERAVTRAGTLDYMAPEVLCCPLKQYPEENKGNRSLQCTATMDSWATGVLVYELLVGFPPFASDDARDCVNKIMSCCVVYPKRMSSGARAFVDAALSAHPGDRPTAVEMLLDPWIAGCLQT